jgi:hypothetical protein
MPRDGLRRGFLWQKTKYGLDLQSPVMAVRFPAVLQDKCPISCRHCAEAAKDMCHVPGSQRGLALRKARRRLLDVSEAA